MTTFFLGEGGGGGGRYFFFGGGVEDTFWGLSKSANPCQTY